MVGQAAADTMENPPHRPFLLGIYELPNTSLASPSGDPQPAPDHIPASPRGFSRDTRVRCGLQGDFPPPSPSSAPEPSWQSPRCAGRAELG